MLSKVPFVFIQNILHYVLPKSTKNAQQFFNIHLFQEGNVDPLPKRGKRSPTKFFIIDLIIDLAPGVIVLLIDLVNLILFLILLIFVVLIFDLLIVLLIDLIIVLLIDFVIGLLIDFVFLIDFVIVFLIDFVIVLLFDLVNDLVIVYLNFDPIRLVLADSAFHSDSAKICLGLTIYKFDQCKIYNICKRDILS